MADATTQPQRALDRAARGGGKATSFIDRLALGFDAFVAGSRTDFFFPTPPMAPVAQPTQGRAYDYPISYNMQAKPRSETGEGMDFATIRSFAENYDLLRLVIETRKDQLCKMEWNIVGRNKKDKIKEDDPRVQELEKFFRNPDGTRTWNDWLRMLVEDMLVIDAATVYPRRTLGGSMYSMEIVDGATIKLLIDDDGRTPTPPNAAYQQILKGMPASNFTTDELIYRPRNRRSWKMYGYSPVEQIVMTVNIALRRQLTQLQYYTEGNIPEAFASVPETWNSDQIARMQEHWDSIIEGDGAQKRKVRFIPGGVDIKQTREATIKDVFDEWLARIVCFAFSISPQALIQMMNRATAETAAEQAMQEGLAPLQTWVKDFIDYIIAKYFGYDDLVFKWADGKELDPKMQSDVHRNYVECGVLDVDEVREELGKDPRGLSPTKEGTALVPNADSLPANGLPADQAATPPGGAAQQEVAAAGAVPSPTLGADGQPLPTTVSGDSDVQGTAMNGTQVSSLIEIVAEVASKNLPKESAKALIMAAYPAVKEETINAMLDPLDTFEKPKPAPGFDEDGNPIIPPGGDGSVPGAKKGVDAVPGSKDDAKDAQPAAKDAVAEKHAHAHEDPLYKAIAQERKKLATALSGVFEEVGKDVAKQIVALRPDPPEQGMSKAARPKPDRLIAKITLKGFGSLTEPLEASISVGSTAAAAKAARGLGKFVDDVQELLKLANTRAEAWATGRAAELIGKNGNNGELADVTRDMLRSTIVQAEEEGWSNARLASEIEDSYAFSESRAKTIARTELKSADSQGALAGWKASGLKMKKEWVRSADDYDCDICEANEAQGPIDIDESFDSGDDTSPAHPNCECAVLPVIDQENL